MSLSVSSHIQNFPKEDRSVFATSDWISAFGENGSVLAVGDTKNTKAVFHTFQYRKLGKTVLICTPFAPHCGLSIQFNSDKTVTRNTDVKHVGRAIAEFLEVDFPGAYIDLALPPEITDIQSFAQSGFDTSITYSYRLDLSVSEDDLLANCSPERRKNIRNARKKEYEVSIHSGDEASLELVRNTLTNSGLNYDMDILKNIFEIKSSFCVSVKHSGELMAVAVIAFDARTAYYVAGGSVKKTGHEGAAALALWKAICESKNKGIDTFDFCGSSVPAIEKFFRGFGGDLVPYFRVRKNNALFDLLKKTKAKLS